jgi:hypothetical protein
MAKDSAAAPKEGEGARAIRNWNRYQHGRLRGHIQFILSAQRSRGFYLGGGRQWTQKDASKLTSEGRKPVEQNEILQSVNTAVGYQIANRMDISLQPRGLGSDESVATTITKVVKQVSDNNQLHWRETEVFTDGMVTGRGYYDVRMSFKDNALGEIVVSTIDPADVIPDPDASEYHPDQWADVTIRRWYTLDEIEQLFGKQARTKVSLMSSSEQEMPVDSDEGIGRSKFGNDNIYAQADAYLFDVDTTRYCVIDRQYRVFEKTVCAVWPTGDIRPIPNATKSQREAYIAQGCQIVTRMMPRVRWVVSTMNVLLFDDYSPYPWFTVVPFFPYFMRGETIGMVDNMISPQEVLNKSLSQFLHIVNTVANSGWMLEDGSVTNLTPEEFKAQGAKNGLVIYYKQGSNPPKKIESSPVPTGLAEVIATVNGALKSVSGVSDVVSGDVKANEMSGVAYQARQYAAQQKLAIPLDNLARTRHILANRIVDLIQMFMDAPRVLRIVEDDEMGNKKTSTMVINQPAEDEAGNLVYLNDMTIGEYDIVVSEQPMQITFDNSQFEQIKTMMIDMKLPIPAKYILKYSNLQDKKDIADSIESSQQPVDDPLAIAKAKLA